MIKRNYTRPCPFCGEREVCLKKHQPKPELGPLGLYPKPTFWIRCMTCSAEGPKGHASEEAAWFAWGLRTPSPHDVDHVFVTESERLAVTSADIETTED